MRVLWLCNIMLPMIAESLHKEASNKEGWLTGLAGAILKNNEDNHIELGVCFPVSKIQQTLSGNVKGISYYGFYEDTVHPHLYDSSMEQRMKEILGNFCPDVIHIFGTEYPHTLAMVRAAADRRKILIGIQGLCSVYTGSYMAYLPEYVTKKTSFRDFVKRDNYRQQRKKYFLRGIREIEALQNVHCITGRTDWDKAAVEQINSAAGYYFLNETLRENFYEGAWSFLNCDKYSIFISQGNYPIKGLHLMLEALPLIREVYPKVKVYVAGDIITRHGNATEKIKLSAYGKYLLKQIKKYGMEEQVFFLGRLNAAEMKERYLKSHVFVSPSSIENSPNAVGESMILGVPTVSSHVGGVANMLTHNEEGFLYQADAPYMLAFYVKKIFSDAALAEKLSVSAKKHAKKTHDRENNYKRLMEIYEDIAGTGE